MEPKFNTNRPEQSPEIKVVNFFSKPDEVVVADDGMIKSEYTTDPNDKSNMVWKLVDSYPDSGDVTNERVTKHRIEY